MKVLLVANDKKAASVSLSQAIQEELAREGALVMVYSYGRAAPALLDYDVAFSLGGDGTALFAARTVSQAGIPLIPLNLGTLGFIAAVRPSDWRRVFTAWREGKAALSGRLMLKVEVARGGKTVFAGCCLNEASVTAAGIARMLRLVALSDGRRLGAYRADGLIAATPTGSTAYCAAAGGPILDPEMEALIVNPVCPFTLFHRPLVFPARETLVIREEGQQRSAAALTLDGQETFPLDAGDEVRLSAAPFKALLVASGREEFFEALQTKLPWSGGAGLIPEGEYA